MSRLALWAVLAAALVVSLGGCRSSPVGQCTDVAPRAASRPWTRPAGATAVPAAIASGVALVEVAADFERPVAAVFAPGERDRMYVVEQGGRIYQLELGGDASAPTVVRRTPWLDARGRVTRAENEQGLLGLAFHPGWPGDARIYLNYTDRSGDTRVVEVPAPGGVPALDRGKELLAVDQPAGNHNGGRVIFGPDGWLWIGLGDGGSAGDPWGNAQSCDGRLGKMLRLDVDSGRVERAANGLRNPWMYSFDRATGDLYIADVGQDRSEWVHVVPASELTGHNFGWNVTEGFDCYGGGDCPREGITPPVVDYGHADGCSITGGFVYRGKLLPALDGRYFFADYCSSLIRSITWKADAVSDHWDWRPALDPDARLARLAAWGEDADGELYLVSLEGGIWKLVPRAAGE